MITSDSCNFILGAKEISRDVTVLALAVTGNAIRVVSVNDPIMGACAHGSLKTGPTDACTVIVIELKRSALIPILGMWIFESITVMLKYPGSNLFEMKTVSS